MASKALNKLDKIWESKLKINFKIQLFRSSVFRKCFAIWARKLDAYKQNVQKVRWYLYQNVESTLRFHLGR